MPSEPLILLGDTETLQVRADIDEVNAPLVVPGSPAVAYLKGFQTDRAISLTFDRIEPYIVPKRSLTGDNRERVDTRVLQVIYQFDRPSFPIYVGQQVDVFIERSDQSKPNQHDGSPDLLRFNRYNILPLLCQRGKWARRRLLSRIRHVCCHGSAVGFARMSHWP